jgi:hypothetical protein
VNRWEDYLAARGLSSGEAPPTFPEEYDVVRRDEFYNSLSANGWGGSCGHDSTMIAYVCCIILYTVRPLLLYGRHVHESVVNNKCRI